MIKIKNLNYRFDKRFNVLFDVNLIVLDSEKICLKSNNFLDTEILFRVLTKQDRDYKGEVIFDNLDLKKIKSKDLSISYITKQPFLLNNKTVLYNIAYPLIVRKIKKVEALEKAKNILKEFNFQELENKKIKELSYYEKIVLTFMRVYVRKPKYLLIDDIFENLDKEQLIKILSLINKIVNKNSALIISTNNEATIKNFKFDRIYSFINGTLNKD